MTATESDTTPVTYEWLDDPVEREWLLKVEPADIVANAHRFYDYLNECGLGADSYTRELAFQKAATALVIDYDVLYDAWMDERPLAKIERTP